MRRLAGNDPEVNEEWITDKDRFAFRYAQVEDRITYPQVREDGELRPASWPEAFAVAARGLRDAGAAGVLTGGRLTAEDAYAYAKFARVSLGTNDIDFRARPHCAEEADFLASHVVLSGDGDLRRPRDRAGRRAGRPRARGRGGDDLPAAAQGGPPGTYAGRVRRALQLARPDQDEGPPGARRARRRGRGHRLARGRRARRLQGRGHPRRRAPRRHPGALSAAADLAARTGARLAWVPRRAGDRGAVEAGCLPNLLPGGRPVADASARVDVAAAWGVESLPAKAGRDGDAIVAALAKGDLGGLVIGGVDPDDTADPAAFRAALDAAGFVVSLELRATDVTAVADVVLPVAPMTDKAGTFVTWEGRAREFGAVFTNPASLPDLRVLAGIADELAALGQGAPLGFRTVAEVRAEMQSLGPWDGSRPTLDAGKAPKPPKAGKAGSFALATWKQLIDLGSMQDGEAHLRATARPPVVRLNRASYESVFGLLQPTTPRPAAARSRPSPVTVGASRCPWWSPTCPTAWSGSRPGPSAVASSPSSPRRAARSP